MFTGATGEYKVWFNGEFLHEYGHSGVWGTDYQEFVPVTLKQGINVLLFGIYSRNDKNDWNVKSGYFGFAPDTEYKVLPPHIIADSNLRAAIAEALDKEDSAPITLEEIATLTTLRASNRDIRDLTGIEAAVNLENLWISGNPITDLSPLAALKNLNGLAAWDMAIEDFSPLAELTNLKWLELFNTPIPDISPLAGLTSLERLRLYGTETENLAPLAGLTNLTLLQIANNETLSDVSPLAGLINLEWLDLHRCDSLSDISSLARLTKLEYLNLNHTRRVYDYSLSPLSGLTGLRRLRLAENRISDVSSLARVISLERLDLPQNQIVDISPLSSLTGLRELYLHENRISDVSSLAGLINLEWLDLRVNQISDISALDGLATRTHISWLKNPGAPIGGPKIEGPWLWVPIPEKQLDNSTDLLSEVSGGSVTEHQIATRGATEGKAVGNYEWTAHKISPIGTYGGLTNNMLEMVRAFGLPEEI
ncbi:MAG: leucine-rich repeat domain-containing protein [Candidatus Poribacteria bacterium]|nr:leucine-rich repeat domain-containing protein [Candidatus Poribacteria bacterium]